jgi:hypothetical protein
LIVSAVCAILRLTQKREEYMGKKHQHKHDAPETPAPAPETETPETETPTPVEDDDGGDPPFST